MNKNLSAHLYSLLLVPAGFHAFFTIIFGFEAESSFSMLLAAAMAAWVIGGYLGKKKYGPFESVLAAAWPIVLAAWGHLHWALNMPSPGGSAQDLARLLGWTDAPMPAAVAAGLIPFGAAGWLSARFSRWYEKKTGHPIFEES